MHQRQAKAHEKEAEIRKPERPVIKKRANNCINGTVQKIAQG